MRKTRFSIGTVARAIEALEAQYDHHAAAAAAGWARCESLDARLRPGQISHSARRRAAAAMAALAEIHKRETGWALAEMRRGAGLDPDRDTEEASLDR